jgi:hypothetical protein
VEPDGQRCKPPHLPTDCGYSCSSVTPPRTWDAGGPFQHNQDYACFTNPGRAVLVPRLGSLLVLPSCSLYLAVAVVEDRFGAACGARGALFASTLAKPTSLQRPPPSKPPRARPCTTHPANRCPVNCRRCYDFTMTVLSNRCLLPSHCSHRPSASAGRQQILLVVPLCMSWRRHVTSSIPQPRGHQVQAQRQLQTLLM